MSEQPRLDISRTENLSRNWGVMCNHDSFFLFSKFDGTYDKWLCREVLKTSAGYTVEGSTPSRTANNLHFEM